MYPASVHTNINTKQLDYFKGSRDANHPGDRLRQVRKGAEDFREWFINSPEVLFYRSINLLRVPYPITLAYHGVFAGSVFLFPPVLHLLNRMFIIQYSDFNGDVRTLLFSPSDHEAGAETPYFKRMMQLLPRYFHDLVSPTYRTVEEALAMCDIAPEDVDFISYDHLHTQDVRKWIGGKNNPGYFPNAKLIVHQQEWFGASQPLPNQKDWYCPSGISDIDPKRLVFFEGDLHLGEGVVLMHTPGHTEGNHSLVCRVPDGIRVTSENGVGSDSYAPEHSSCSRIRNYALSTGARVILNGNTQESSNDQYLSMIQEKVVAGPSENPDFPNCVTSSEATPFWLFPGKGGTHLFGERTFGTVQKKMNKTASSLPKVEAA
ncbi:MAG: hypothetical protein AAF228_07065 [Pseudomonadota bacterium]